MFSLLIEPIIAQNTQMGKGIKSFVWLKKNDLSKNEKSLYVAKILYYDWKELCNINQKNKK